MADDVAKEGWYGPGGSKKFHFFGEDLRSLCGKWMLWATPQAAGGDWGDSQNFSMQGDCVACVKALAKRTPA